MDHEAYTLKTLTTLGIPKILKGCEYIICSVEYLLTLDKHTVPNSNTLYRFVAHKFFLEPAAIENSIRNTIQNIWTNKVNPELMITIFGPYNLDKRPGNMEFLILLYNYVCWHFEATDTLRKLDSLWFCHPNTQNF